MGIAGTHYAQGPLTLSTLASFGAWVGTLLAVFYLGRKFKALRYQTMPEFFKNRFQSKSVSVVASIIMIVGLMGYGVIQMMGAGLILAQITGIPYVGVVGGMCLVLFIFSASGGMRSVVITDTLMLLAILVIAAIISPYLAVLAGGPEHVVKDTTARLGADYWTLGGLKHYAPSWSFIQMFVWIAYYMCLPAFASRVFPAKNDFVLLKAGCVGMFLGAFLQIMPYFVGSSAMQTLQPDITPDANALIIGFTDYIPAALGGFALAGLMAAIMSTASTLFILAGIGLSKDLFDDLFLAGKTLTDKQRINHARVGQLALTVIVYFVTISRPPAIYFFFLYAGALFGVGWLPTVMAGLHWRRVTNQGVVASMLIGVASYVGIDVMVKKGLLTLPWFLDPFFSGLACSTVALIVGSLLTKPTKENMDYYDVIQKAQLSEIYIERARKDPKEFIQMKKDYKSTYVVALVTVVVAAVIFIGLGLMYGLPLL
jgi:sodium/pantothenate symporter